jgi:phage tail-like protein
MNNSEALSKYIKYIPAIFYKRKEEPLSDFLGRFLMAFEEQLSGIEKKLDIITKYLDPDFDPNEDPYFDPDNPDNILKYFNPDEKAYLAKIRIEFLHWLAGWVALILRKGEDWNEKKNRDLISRIVQLYCKRGTREGLEEYIKIYVGEDIKLYINEFLEPFRVGRTSTVGENSVVGEGLPYYFELHMVLPEPDPGLLKKKRQALYQIIDQEKPAHTYFGLTIDIPTMRIGVYSTVGSDTLLW